jgi:UDP-N-acetylmuramate dehydrogenase
MNFQEQVSLVDYTTLRAGGTARYLFSVVSEDELLEALSFAEEKKLPVHILGGGSNTLFSDSGFPGVVIHMENMGMSFFEDENGVVCVAEAGEEWNAVVQETARRGYFGLELLTGIPGTVGGAIVQNIGAYGSEVRENVLWVEVYDRKQKEMVRLENNVCCFEYRDSLFKKEDGRYIVLRVAFRLWGEVPERAFHTEIEKEMKDGLGTRHPAHISEAVIRVRTGKLPDWKKIGTAGSFFKNPVVDGDVGRNVIETYPNAVHTAYSDGRYKFAAGWLIDHVAGMRGVREGNVGTWEHQALVIVNEGRENSEEIQAFVRKVQQKVHDQTGIMLESEVVVVK